MNREIINNKIFDFVYCEALKDATLRNTCSSDIREKLFSFNKNDSELGIKIKKKVEEYIGLIVSGRLKEDTCEKIIVEICNETNAKDEKSFTFGNAQKLVNMSAKYFYISTYKGSKSHREKFKFCHCPMDSIMMDILTNKYWNEISNDEIKHKKDLNGKPWSSLMESDESDIWQYENYQKAIQILLGSDSFTEKNGSGLYPIEVDYCIWRES